MQPLIVYLGRDNTEDLVLFADGVPQSLSGVTRVALTVGGVTVDSQTAPAGTIAWPQAVTWQGAAASAIRFKLGAQALAAGTHGDCRLVIYDASNPGGLVWTDSLLTKVKS